MDLVQILRERIDGLPSGTHTPGFRAILRHVEAAVRHFHRARQTGDDTLYSDAIYRTNQAFEGSLKEAYRVVAQKDPAKVTPAVIEQFFQKDKRLRQRVLDQFTAYRTKWRNPSTHDHLLDFDEDEALLAITTIATLAIVLADQVAEHLAFERTKEASAPAPQPTGPTDLLSLVSRTLLAFPTTQLRPYLTQSAARQHINDAYSIGAIAGYLSSSLVHHPTVIGGTSDTPCDIRVGSQAESVLIEIKHADTPLAKESGLDQLRRFMAATGARNSILYIIGDLTKERIATPHALDDGARAIIIAPNH